MKIVAVDDKIVVKQMNKVSKTKGGLFIPDTVKTEPQMYGKVISVGECVKNVKEGDIIMFHQKGGMAVVVDKELMLVLKYADVYCIISGIEDELQEAKIGGE